MKKFKNFLNETIKIENLIVTSLYSEKQLNNIAENWNDEILFDFDDIFNEMNVNKSIIKLNILNDNISLYFRSITNGKFEIIAPYFLFPNSLRLENSNHKKYQGVSFIKANLNLMDILDIFDLDTNTNKITYQIHRDETFIKTNFTQVKIDKNIKKEISNLIVDAGFERKGDLTKKIEFLSDIKNKGKTIQSQISGIILLDYLSEIKNNFNATTAGFLIEGFIAGLIDAHNFDDNSAVDVVYHKQGYQKGRNYQIKFWEGKTTDMNKYMEKKKTTQLGNLINRMKEISDRENYILMILKEKNNKLNIINIPLNDYVIQGLTENIEPGQHGPRFTFTQLKEWGKNPNTFPKPKNINNKNNKNTSLFDKRRITSLGIIDLSNIDEQLFNINKDLKTNLEDLWINIKKLQIDVQDMTTKNTKEIRNKYKLKGRTPLSPEKQEASKQAKKVDKLIQNTYKTIINNKLK